MSEDWGVVLFVVGVLLGVFVFFGLGFFVVCVIWVVVWMIVEV